MPSERQIIFIICSLVAFLIIGSIASYNLNWQHLYKGDEDYFEKYNLRDKLVSKQGGLELELRRMVAGSAPISYHVFVLGESEVIPSENQQAMSCVIAYSDGAIHKSVGANVDKWGETRFRIRFAFDAPTNRSQQISSVTITIKDRSTSGSEKQFVWENIEQPKYWIMAKRLGR